MAAASLLVVVALWLGLAPAAAPPAAAARGHLRYMTFFSDKDCNATAVAAMKGWSNLCISGNLARLRRAQKSGMASGLSLVDAQNILQQTPGQGPNDWAVWRKPDGPCLRNATCINSWNGLGKRWKDTVLCILGKVGAMKRPDKVCHRSVPRLEVLFLGDELCDGGIPLANLSTVADFVRAQVGPDVTLWTNEGVSAFTRAPTAPSYIGRVPAALDLVSLDSYNVSDPVAEAAQTAALYEKYIFPRLAGPHQRVMFVPGTVGCIPGSTFPYGPKGRKISWGQCNTSLEVQGQRQAAKMAAYFAYALGEPRVAGFSPWRWFTEPRKYFPTEPQYVLGADAFPALQEELKRIGSAIIRNNSDDGQAALLAAPTAASQKQRHVSGWTAFHSCGDVLCPNMSRQIEQIVRHADVLDTVMPYTDGAAAQYNGANHSACYYWANGTLQRLKTIGTGFRFGGASDSPIPGGSGMPVHICTPYPDKLVTAWVEPLRRAGVASMPVLQGLCTSVEGHEGTFHCPPTTLPFVRHVFTMARIRS